MDDQIAQLQAYNAKVEAEAERERERERKQQAAAAAVAAAARRKTLPNTATPKITTTRSSQFLSTPTVKPTTRAPSPSPRRSLAPPKPQQAQRRKSSSGLNSFLKGALQVTSAVLQAENRALRAQNGGGFGGSGGGGFNGNTTFVDTSGGGGFDMSSFWAPINSAAGDPIQ